MRQTGLLLWELLFMQYIFSLSHYMMLSGLKHVLLDYRENAAGQFLSF